jgi:drug/metabolite transporter (DMT)-like permease
MGRGRALTELALATSGGSSARRALAGAAVFGVLWTLIEVQLGGMLRQAYNPIEVVWWRYAVHLLLACALWGFTRRQAMVRTNRPMFHVARSMLMVTMPLAYVIGVYYAGVPSGFMWSVFWTAPATIMLFSWWRLGERPTALWLALAVVGAFACVLIYGHVRTPSLLGLVCAGGMQLSFVAYFVMTRMLHEERTEANLFYTALGPFVVLGLLLPFIWVKPDLHDVVVMTAIGVLGFIGLYALDLGCHTEPASVSAPGLFAHVPVVLALTFLGQGVQLETRAAVGSIILLLVLALTWMLASVALSSRIERKGAM